MNYKNKGTNLFQLKLYGFEFDFRYFRNTLQYNGLHTGTVSEEFEITIALAFNDIEKAFDSIYLRIITQFLNSQVVDKRYVETLTNMYNAV